MLPLYGAVVGFEEGEGYSPVTSIAAISGWELDSDGAAEIEKGESPQGEQYLRVKASVEPKEIRWQLPAIKESVVFVQFMIAPAISAGETLYPLMDVCGAAITFVEEEDGIARLYANTDDESVPSEKLVAINVDGSACEWIQLTLRLDRATGVWDLFVDGELILVSQPLTNKGGRALTLRGVSQDYFVDALWAGAGNPLFPDADSDGIPDIVEYVNGTNAFYSDRDFDFNSDGFRNIENFKRGESITTAPEKGLKTIYVDNVNGDDQYSGASAYRSGATGGPKRTLREATRVGGRGAAFVLMPSNKPYICPNYPTGQAPVDRTFILMDGVSLAGE